MAVSSLTASTQDYLKVIWAATEWEEDTTVSVTYVAESLGVRTSTASDGLKKLTEQGLVVHKPYGGVTLTELGHSHAVDMVRRHRLIETFLVNMMGYTWDEVHDEAEVLEHAMSDTLVNRLDAVLGHPERDPHGDPIPDAAGTPRRQNAFQLGGAEVGVTLTVSRIADDNPEMLRYFADLGLRPGVTVSVVEHRPYAGVSSVIIGDADAAVDLGSVALASVWVEK
ncbi:manganese-binding transcriptional regulator MntR [Klugiella xanthotipulae]|uniref:Manganese transport regulator n=1 Tax=Klugiella xanthotipulae TaxID=244735 RepID=A0A543I730_9MICO|nr:metal-dependent transcriptional regulator [Klugiella xanthotipulae]TQM66349.1 DtxR family iron (metal) dependent repressor [Klugiella xanthotipulae]